MSSFISALIKQRKEAKKAEPHSDGRLKEILAVLKKYNYDDGITPEINEPGDCHKAVAAL